VRRTSPAGLRTSLRRCEPFPGLARLREARASLRRGVGKKRMKIARSVVGFGILVMACGGACANQKSEQAAPAASPNSVALSAPATEAAPAPPPAAAPAPMLDQSNRAEAAREDDFTTLEAAERALDQAKADLDRLALAEPAPTLGRGVDSEKAAKKPARSSAPSAAGAAAPAGVAPNGQCESACKAFASLSRAANAVCRLDGDGGSHCAKAKKVVTDSAGRVAACTCPAPGQ